jgi:acetate---CoA ligase (ADP-forming)
MADLQFALAPLSDRDVSGLIERSRASRLINGHRGRPVGDMEALVELISRTSIMSDAVPDITEIDMNPRGRGCELVDVRIRVGTTPVTPTH